MRKPEQQLSTIPMQLELQTPHERLPVVDPLEGVIEGGNRHERFQLFAKNVLGKIWPQITETSSEGMSEYAKSVWAAARFRDGSIDGYVDFAPDGIDPLTLSPHELEHTVSFLGPDYLRVRLIDPRIAHDSDNAGVIVGGSCILETRLMRSATELKKAVSRGIVPQEELIDFARQGISMAPTMTHVSGVFNPTIEYDESAMWIERLSKEYGMAEEEATDAVRGAYEKINQAILRRSQLVNPDHKMITVNFDELDLEGEISRWFDEIHLPYDKTHKIFDVIATYIGPEAKQQVNNALQKRLDTQDIPQEDAMLMQAVIDSQYHVRIKQMDHGGWESLDLPRDHIIGQRKTLSREERNHCEEDYTYRAAITILKDYYDRHQKTQRPHTAFAGFADLPGYGGSVAHKERSVFGKFNGQPGTEDFKTSLDASFSNPSYLHTGNVDEHLQYLQGFAENVSTVRQRLITQKQDTENTLKPLLSQKSKLENELKSSAKSIERYDKTELEQRTIVQLLTHLITHPDVLATDVEEAAAQREHAIINSNIISLRERVALGGETVEQDTFDISELENVNLILENIHPGNEKPRVPSSLHGRFSILQEHANRAIDSTRRARIQTREKIENNTRQLHIIEEDATYIELLKERVLITDKIQQLGKGAFPLHDNPFVHHAMQFLFDPDFPAYLNYAVGIQEQLLKNRPQILAIQSALLEKIDPDISDEEKIRVEQKRREMQQTLTQLKKQETIDRIEANEKMTNLSALIYPKLITYIRWIFGKTAEYPIELRNTKLLAG